MGTLGFGGRRRPWPDQIGTLSVAKSTAGSEGHFSSCRKFPPVIRAIQRDGIQNEIAVIREMVAKRLAVYEIGGRTLQQIRYEFRQRLRIGTVPTSVPLQGNGRDDNAASSLCIGGPARQSLAWHLPLCVQLPGQSQLSQIQQALHARGIL